MSSASNGSYHPPATTCCPGQKPASKNPQRRTAPTPRSTPTRFDPVDADPADPAYRSFTTELGTADDYWYRVVFADTDGDISIATVPLQNSADATPITVEPYATAAELATIIQVNATSNAAALDRVLIAAAGEINTRDRTHRPVRLGTRAGRTGQPRPRRRTVAANESPLGADRAGLGDRADPDRPRHVRPSRPRPRTFEAGVGTCLASPTSWTRWPTRCSPSSGLPSPKPKSRSPAA